MVKQLSVAAQADEQDLICWVKLIHDSRWTRLQKITLLEYFGSPTAILQASPSRLRSALKGGKMRTAARPSSNIEQDLDWLRSPEHDLITLSDQRYPEALKHIPDPPLALYAVGRLELLQRACVAMVGSRRPTPAGHQVTSRLARELSQAGLVVVSGMALGVDGLAHEAVLNSQGDTIAVLGSGLARPSPARHERLFNRLVTHGLVLSEYPVTQHATRYSFPERNRIISGLSAGVVVIEAASRSGTLITARLAAEQGREVMVVPGTVLSRQYQGSHQLIQHGAALVQSSLDVLDVLGLTPAATRLESDSEDNISKHLPSQCRDLLRHIAAQETTVDSLILTTGLTPSEVSSMLITLELAGAVTQGSCGGYINITQLA